MIYLDKLQLYFLEYQSASFSFLSLIVSHWPNKSGLCTSLPLLRRKTQTSREREFNPLTYSQTCSESSLATPQQLYLDKRHSHARNTDLPRPSPIFWAAAHAQWAHLSIGSNPWLECSPHLSNNNSFYGIESITNACLWTNKVMAGSLPKQPNITGS